MATARKAKSKQLPGPPKKKQGQRGKDKKPRRGSTHHPTVITTVTNEILAARRERAAQAREIRAQQLLTDPTGLDDPMLTDLQRNFIIEYSFDRNKTAAYRRAKGKVPGEFAIHDTQAAAALFRNVHVKNLLTQLDASAALEMKTSREELFTILIGHARSNIDDFAHISEDGVATLDLNKASRSQLRSITEIVQRKTVRRVRGSDDEEEEITDTKLKRVDPLKAIELLGKTPEYRMFSDSLEVYGPDGKPLAPPQLQVVLVAPNTPATTTAQMAPPLPRAIEPPPLIEADKKEV